MKLKSKLQSQEGQFSTEEKENVVAEKRKEEAKQVLYITRV